MLLSAFYPIYYVIIASIVLFILNIIIYFTEFYFTKRIVARVKIEKNQNEQVFIFNIISTAFIFLLSIWGWVTYIKNCLIVDQDLIKIKFLRFHGSIFNEKKDFLNFFIDSNSFGIDGISFFFIVLSTFLFFLCTLALYSFPIKNKSMFFVLFSFLQLSVLMSFVTLNYLIFYICFEAILIPMFLIIGIWGSRSRKAKAAIYFFFYSFMGSIFMLFGIFLIYFYTGSLNWRICYLFNFDLELQKIIWFLLFISFAIKVPMWPFHIWLPEAHVEAPTVGSIILAGLLLKLGGYGFLRFVLPIFTEGTTYFLPLANTLCILGIVYASLTTLRQIDLKRIIAYSSVAHMSYGMLGIFSLNYYGILGSILLMLGHGLVSSALFYIVGILYEIYGTRIIFYYGGIGQIMPIFSFFFLFFIFANAGLPGLGIFPGEFFIALGVFTMNPLGIVISILASVLTIAYMVLLYNRIVFGTFKIQYYNPFFKPSIRDLNKLEFFILIIFSYTTLVFGLCPQIFISVIEPSILKNLNLYNYKY